MSNSARGAARKRIMGLLAIVAPSLLVGSPLAFATHGGGGFGRPGAAVLIFATIVIALVIVGLAMRLWGAFPGVGAVLLLIGLAGVVGGAAFGVDRASAAAVGHAPLDRAAGAESALPTLLPPSGLLPIALIGIGGALLLAEPARRWRGALVALAGALLPISRYVGTGQLEGVTDLLYAVTVALIGWSVLCGRRQGSGRRSGPALT